MATGYQVWQLRKWVGGFQLSGRWEIPGYFGGTSYTVFPQNAVGLCDAEMARNEYVASQIWSLYTEQLRTLEGCARQLEEACAPDSLIDDLLWSVRTTMEWLSTVGQRIYSESMLCVLRLVPADKILDEVEDTVDAYKENLRILRDPGRPVSRRCEDVVNWVRNTPGGLRLWLREFGVWVETTVAEAFFDRRTDTFFPEIENPRPDFEQPLAA